MRRRAPSKLFMFASETSGVLPAAGLRCGEVVPILGLPMTAPVDARSLRGWTWTAATRGMLAAIEAVNSPPSPPSTHTRHKSRASKRSLVVLDYWEKLAGASLALSAIVRLCQNANISLAAPRRFARRSSFHPAAGRSLRTTILRALRAVLAPQQLISFKRAQQSALNIGCRPQ